MEICPIHICSLQKGRFLSSNLLSGPSTVLYHCTGAISMCLSCANSERVYINISNALLLMAKRLLRPGTVVKAYFKVLVFFAVVCGCKQEMA